MITADDPADHESVQQTLRSIPRIVKEAFHIARTGRPGPVLVDFPKNIQLATLEGEIDLDPPMNLPGYRPELRTVAQEQINQVIAADPSIAEADPLRRRRHYQLRSFRGFSPSLLASPASRSR